MTKECIECSKKEKIIKSLEEEISALKSESSTLSSSDNKPIFYSLNPLEEKEYFDNTEENFLNHNLERTSDLVLIDFRKNYLKRKNP